MHMMQCDPYGDEHVCKRIIDILKEKEYHLWNVNKKIR